MTERWDICVHEAGHVVVGFHLGIPVLRAIVFRSSKAGQSLGETVAMGGYVVPDAERVAWCMAGHVAQRALLGMQFPDWIDRSPDYAETRQYHPDQYHAGLDLAEQIISEQKVAVVRVAERLRDHRGWCYAASLKTAVGK